MFHSLFANPPLGRDLDGPIRTNGSADLREVPDLTIDTPQSEIVATNFYDRPKFWAENWAKNWAKFWTKFSGFFVLHLLYRTAHQVFSPNSSQFITPCLATAPVTEISKFHLRELLGLGVPN